jgi:hypothetical protein
VLLSDIVTAHVLPFTDVTHVFCILLLASMFIHVHAQYVVFARGTFTHICPLAFNCTGYVLFVAHAGLCNASAIAVSLHNLTIHAVVVVALEYVVLLALISFVTGSIVIFAHAVNTSCLSFKAFHKFVLSYGSHAIFQKLTVFQWLLCNNQTEPSYTYTSHTSNSSVSAVLDAVHV